MKITKYDADVLVESRDASSSKLFSVVKQKPFDLELSLPVELEDLPLSAKLVFAEGGDVPFVKSDPLTVSFFFGQDSSISSLQVTAQCKISCLSSQLENSYLRILFLCGENTVATEKIRTVSKKSQLSAQPKRKRTTQLATRQAVLQALSSFSAMMQEQRMMMEELKEQNSQLASFNSQLMDHLEHVVTIPASPDFTSVEQDSKRIKLEDDLEDDLEDAFEDEEQDGGEYPLEFGSLKFF